jgi:hypothetical protein
MSLGGSLPAERGSAAEEGGRPTVERGSLPVEGGSSAAAAQQVPVPTAARLLGLSERGVRWRIQTGALAAIRTPVGWRVLLPAAEGGSRAADGGSATEEGGSPPVESGSAAAPAALDVALGTIAAQEVEIARLHERLRESLLVQAQLAAALETRALPSGDTPGAPPRPWWAALLWWRR